MGKLVTTENLSRFKDNIENIIPEVSNSLYSDDTTKALSAAQGKHLREMVEQAGGGEFAKSFTIFRIVFNKTYRNGALSPKGSSVAEFKLFNEDDDDITHLEGATYQSDSIYKAAFDTQYAFDNDPATSWGSLDTPNYGEHWLQVTFTEPQVVAGMGIMPKTNSYSLCQPYKITLIGSNDGVSWTSLAIYDGLDSGWEDVVLRKFDVEVIMDKSMEEAPKDGNAYVRKNGAWSNLDTIGMDLVMNDAYPRPSSVITINFNTDEAIPTTKDEENPILAHGSVDINIDGHRIKKYATIEVQGKSSANKPKKNYTFCFYNDEDCTESYSFRIGNMVSQSQYVYKANYIDSTQARNIAANRLWEQIIYSHDTNPFRYNEGVLNYDSGALCHVDGFPCVVYFNGTFYGIGDFNLGKKRDNYDLSKTNQDHIQMQAEPRADFTSYVEAKWELRNPAEPDDDFLSKIGVWFEDNARTTDFAENFENHHDLRNVIDYYLMAEYLYADDILDNNVQLTTWDGSMFYMLPYDLDTVWGLAYNGTAIADPTSGTVLNSTLNGALPNGINANTKQFWLKFINEYFTDIVARFDELVEKEIFNTANVARIFSELQRPFGSLYQKDLDKWVTQPSRNITSYKQVLDWSDNRLAYLQTMFHPTDPE